MKAIAGLLVSVIVVIPIGAKWFDGLEPIEAEHAKAFGKILSDEAGKIEKPQIKIVADPEKANGVHVPQHVGALIVPQKDLTFGEEFHAKLQEEKGASLAYLFLYHLVPIVNGKPLDPSRLRTVSLTDESGNTHTVYVLLISGRQISDDDYRLYAFGQDEKTLVDAKFSEGNGPGPEPVAVEIKEVDEQNHQGKLVVTVFGKYQATFTVGHRE